MLDEGRIGKDFLKGTREKQAKLRIGESWPGFKRSTSSVGH
jgi:hypothetical protein